MSAGVIMKQGKNGAAPVFSRGEEAAQASRGSFHIAGIAVISVRTMGDGR